MNYARPIMWSSLKAMRKFLRPFDNDKKNYTLYGVLFGLCFPVIASFLQDKTNILLWIICTARVFLGAFAYLAGSIQDETEFKVNQRTQELKKGK